MAEHVRQFLYAIALATMVLAMWATCRATQLQAVVHLGWMDAPPKDVRAVTQN